jgi:hypothetical protein
LSSFLAAPADLSHGFVSAFASFSYPLASANRSNLPMCQAIDGWLVVLFSTELNRCG